MGRRLWLGLEEFERFGLGEDRGSGLRFGRGRRIVQQTIRRIGRERVRLKREQQAVIGSIRRRSAQPFTGLRQRAA